MYQRGSARTRQNADRSVRLEQTPSQASGVSGRGWAGKAEQSRAADPGNGTNAGKGGCGILAHKKSFVLYFDDFPCVEALPSDQRGELLSLLFRYAIAEDRAPTEPMELADQVPGLTDQTRMAFQFIAKTIRRDTMNWKEKEYRYQTAARRRMAKRSGGESIRRRDFQPERGDNSWMRKYIQQRDKGV